MTYQRKDSRLQQNPPRPMLLNSMGKTLWRQIHTEKKKQPSQKLGGLRSNGANGSNRNDPAAKVRRVFGDSPANSPELLTGGQHRKACAWRVE